MDAGAFNLATAVILTIFTFVVGYGFVVYNETINTKFSVDELATTLQKKGGHINKYYLQEWNRNKHAVVFLKVWFGGKNIREALLKALL